MQEASTFSWTAHIRLLSSRQCTQCASIFMSFSHNSSQPDRPIRCPIFFRKKSSPIFLLFLALPAAHHMWKISAKIKHPELSARNSDTANNPNTQMLSVSRPIWTLASTWSRRDSRPWDSKILQWRNIKLLRLNWSINTWQTVTKHTRWHESLKNIKSQNSWHLKNTPNAKEIMAPIKDQQKSYDSPTISSNTWHLRGQGLPVWHAQKSRANLLKQDRKNIRQHWTVVNWMIPFCWSLNFNQI